MKQFSKLITIVLVLVMCIGILPVSSFAEEPVIVPTVELIGLAEITDGVIKITADASMNLVVYQKAGDDWIQVTQPIEKMGAAGASATGVAGAWANALPWSASTGTGTNNFRNESAKILSAQSSYVTTGAPNRLWELGRASPPAGAGTDAGEALLCDEFVVIDYKYETGVKTYASGEGLGNRLTLVGLASSINLVHTLVLETGAMPGAVSVSSYYTYVGLGSLAVTKFVDNNFKIEEEPLDKLIMYDENGNPDTKIPDAGLWSWQGCDVSSSQIEHTVAPVLDTMGTMDPGGAMYTTTLGHTMSRNNWHWYSRSGVAYNYFWGKTLGLATGSLMPYHIYGLELPVRGSGINGNSNIGYTWVGWPGKTLQTGIQTYIGTSLIGVADGDFGMGNNLYARTMDNVDLKPFIDRGDFIARTDVNESVTPWSFVVEGMDYAIPRYDYKYAESTSDYKGVPLNLLKLPTGDEIAPWALGAAWESWGYGQSMAPRALFYLIPILPRLGYTSVIYDAYWYSHGGPGADPIYMPMFTGQSGVSGTECNWDAVAPLLSDYFAKNPHPEHKVAGDAYDFSNLDRSTQMQANRCVRAMNEYIHMHGMKAVAWAQNGLVLNSAVNSGRVPASWRVYNHAGSVVNTQGCAGNPEFVNTQSTYQSELIFGTGKGEFAFDGYKGDTIHGIAPCYATGHGHDGDPYAPMRNYGLYIKNLYDKANYIRGATQYVGGPIIDVNKMAAVKQCYCGRVMNYYSYAGINRPIYGDHNGTKVNRQGNKCNRGFFGWDIPMDSDHHDLDFRGGTGVVGDFDYATALGTGMLYASKTRFNLNVFDNNSSESSSLMNWPGAPNYNQKTGLTGMTTGSIKWGRAVKYYGLYNDFEASQSRMIGNLYRHVVDYPEAYAIELMDKDPVTGKLTVKPVSERLYSFYASSYPVEPTDPYLRSGSGSRYYRELATGNSGGRIYDPWNSVYKDIPNTTNTIVANTPFKFVFKGPIELRGLEPFTAYFLTDVETGEKLQKTSDAFGNIAFETEFVNSVIYHVTKVASGSIAGFVYDEDGALLPGATITLYNTNDEKVFWDTASDLDGFYSFPVVPAGQYYIKHTFPKEYVTPLAGTAAVPNNDTRYDGYTTVNMDYFDNVFEYVTAPFTVSNAERTIDLGLGAQPLGRVDGIPISIDFVDYDVWLEAYSKLEGVNAVEMVFSFDGGDMLSYLGFGGTLAELGFTPINLDAGAVGGVTWTQLPNGWRGKLLLGLSTKNVDLAGIIEKLITLSFQASKLGEVTLTVESLKISSLPEGGKVKTYEVNFPGGSESYTTVVHAFHPKYDLNKDGKVNIMDISIALAAVTWVSTAPGWDSYQVALTDAGGVITPSMVDVSQNLLGDGVIDILDVLDILRNFT